MGHDIQSCEARADQRGSHPLTVAAPRAHAGLALALDACFGKPAALPEELRRLLDRLR